MKRFLLSLLIVGFVAQAAWSQVSDEQRDRRRAFLEGLLRTAIESQIPQVVNPPTQPVPTQPPANLQPPGHRPPTQPGHGHTHRPPVVDPQIVNLKRALQSFSGELDGLIAMLQQEERYSPAIRPLLGDAVRIKSAAAILLANATRITSPSVLTESFQAVDLHWRVLAHRLRHVQNLSRACRASIVKVDTVEQQLCGLLGIEPQLDRNSLITKLIALRTNLANLIHDVAVDVRDTKLRSRILIDGRRVMSEIDESITTIGRRSKNAEVIKEYQEAFKLWSALTIELRRVGSVSVARNLLQIDKLNAEIHELLWLELPLDRAALAHYAKTIRHEYDCLCGDLSLSMLLTLPDPPKTTAAMGAFVALVDDFGKSIAQNASADDLRWDYRLLDVEWHQIEAQVVKLGVDGIAKHAATICGTVDALRDTLQIPPEFDREMAAQLAASVDQWAARYDMQVRSLVFRPGMYPHQEAAKIAAASDTFHDAAHQLHECIIRGESVDDLRSDCMTLADAWQKLAIASGRLIDGDRRTLAQATEQLVPQIAKLQILLAY